MSNDNDPWDDLPQGDYVKWERVGDAIAGTIVGKSLAKDLNDNLVPHLVIRTVSGDERQLTASQANLKHQLVALKPKVGDKIAITFSSTERAAKGERKVFTIQHEAGAGAPAAAAGPNW